MKETLYYNGDIITMEKENYAEAVLVKDGIIEKVGKRDEVFTYKNENTEIIDLQGKTLMPAFIDSHSHITSLANTLGIVALHDTKNFKDIVNKLRAFKEDKALKKGEWIIGFGYDHNFLEEKEHPTKEVLDMVSEDNPVMIAHASGHMGVMNSAALKEVGITSSTANPEGGLIGRIAGTDEPNGYLEENAFIQKTGKVLKPSLEKMCGLMEEAQNIYFQYGITTAQDGLVRENEAAILKAVSEKKLLKIDVVGYVDLKNSKAIMEDSRKYLKNYVNRFKIGGYKIFLDGSPQGRTAWMSKPYEDAEDGYRGYPIYKDEEVEGFVETAINENIQLLTHCNGDAAADQLISSFKKTLNKTQSKENIRPVMIHAQTLRYDQLDEMKKLHMIPSYFVAHTYYWGDIHIKNLGKERAFKISPLRKSIEKGVIYTLHQDAPVVSPDMLHTVWCAVNRITKNGVEIGPDERVEPLEALKGVTINAAYQYFEEDTKGSIKEGKLADLIILDRNPLKVNPMEIKDIKVMETIKEGNTVYSKKQ
ncbi:amidohydrolase [Clostridium polynesiense]|uniref:amidohydrolase n=1 Tax=Clostridium polynesiense TaxID=1325933 RepID=UPI00058C8ED2|nr:amidohydrolase [Clostridium polynesiense]